MADQWGWTTRGSGSFNLPETPSIPDIDWSTIKPTTPNVPQIDWSTIKPTQPIRQSLPAQPDIPQIDWSTIKPTAPIKSYPNLSLGPDTRQDIPTEDADVDMGPQLDIPGIQLEPRQYLPKPNLGEGSQMPRGTYDEANRRKTDIELKPGAPPLKVPMIRDYAQKLTNALVPSFHAEKQPNLTEDMRQLVGKPLAENVPLALNKAGIGPTWDALNEPLFPEAEAAPGEWLNENLPVAGPYAQKVSDFLMGGVTSPGGLLTLGGGYALKKGLGTGGYLAKKFQQANKWVPPPTIIGPLTKAEALSKETLGFKLFDEIEKAKITRAAQEKLYTKTLKQRVANRAKVTATGIAGLLERKKTLAGHLPTEQFTPVIDKFNRAEHEAMIDLIEGSPYLQQLDKASAQTGLEKLLGAEIAGVPEMSELQLLEKVFPGISKIKKPGEGFIHGVGEFGGAARALESSMDLSFPGRQGAWLASRPQYMKSWKPMFEGISDTGYAQHMEDIVKRKHYDLGQRVKLDVTDARNIFGAEDEFSAMISKMDGIRHSAQGYSAFGNTLRQSMFDDLVDAAILNGKNPYKNKKVANDIAKYINAATGRGGLSDFFKKHQYTLNQTLFSPRLVSSRLNLLKRATYDVAKTGYNAVVGGVDLKRLGNLPFSSSSSTMKSLGSKVEQKMAGINVPKKTLFPGKSYEVTLPGVKKGRVYGLKHTEYGGKKLGLPVEKGGIGLREYSQVDPFVRRQFWRDFVGYAATQTVMMAPFKAAQMMGGDVEFSADPTNPNFGKAKIGNVRFDSNGGFQPYLRAFSQIMQQKKTSSVSGKVTHLGEGYRPETDFDVLQKLILGKASPLASLGINMLRGETFTGEPTTLTSEMQSKLTPIFAQDIVEVLREDPRMIPLLIPTFFGTGLQVYGPGDIKKQSKKNPYAISVSRPRIKLNFGR